MPVVAEPLHDLEQLLDDDRREPERQLVDDQHLGLVHERHRQGEHLLLAARQVAGGGAAALARAPGTARPTLAMRRASFVAVVEERGHREVLRAR